ncbi:cryptochrome/photolyase family protein [Algirhabdus cladophorae]|uniref:cryptochrome/photolyase family protein n=1 Tax=Algirhabdus cladophorae TaxID=3377108 RepID=UPI003B846F56
MVARLVLVLGDQLTPSLSALAEADPSTDVVVMAEVLGEASYVPHHPKKIALIFAAMRKFAQRLRSEGWRVDYTVFDDPDTTGTIEGELMRRASDHAAHEILATEPGEWRLISILEDMQIPVQMLPDTRFLASHKRFEDWAEGRKQLRMEYFYREMRRETGLLMDGKDPAGGKWNFDHDNRKPAPDAITFDGPIRFEPDGTVQQVLDLVAQQFPDNFGDLDDFWFATDATQAQQQLDHFIKDGLAQFGDFQDAMLLEHRFLYHGLISFYMNIGLLDPLQVCKAAEAAYRAGSAPINAVEGFIRQILGWREYIRGIYFLQGPEYTNSNGLEHHRDLPALYWGGETKMQCLSKAVEQTRAEAYAHHIQRLMVTGNFALLAGIDPAQVHEWYLAVYADAFEWVEAPNTIGMSQFADGGIVASKPYVSSGSYINKMSNYCKTCHYSVSQKTGEGACPFNLLYWDFLMRHKERFEGNPRMGQMYRVWDKMEAGRKETVLAEAAMFLENLDAGRTV